MHEQYELHAEGKEESIAEVRERLALADSCTRAGWLCILLGLTGGAADTWHTVGELWSVCDNIGAWRREFDEDLRRYRDTRGFPIVDAMDAEGQALFATLPDVVTVFRGCYKTNVRGLSWSLNRAVAEHFPTLMRYRRPGRTPLLITGGIRRSQTAFVRTDRNEAEVIAPWRSVRVVSIEPLRGATAEGDHCP